MDQPCGLLGTASKGDSNSKASTGSTFTQAVHPRRRNVHSALWGTSAAAMSHLLRVLYCLPPNTPHFPTQSRAPARLIRCRHLDDGDILQCLLHTLPPVTPLGVGQRLESSLRKWGMELCGAYAAHDSGKRQPYPSRPHACMALGHGLALSVSPGGMHAWGAWVGVGMHIWGA